MTTINLSLPYMYTKIPKIERKAKLIIAALVIKSEWEPIYVKAKRKVAMMKAILMPVSVKKCR